jgi:hypothetical protein
VLICEPHEFSMQLVHALLLPGICEKQDAAAPPLLLLEHANAASARTAEPPNTHAAFLIDFIRSPG